MTGRVVSYLKNGVQEPGRYKIAWNAVDMFGRRLSGGIYIYQIKTEKFVKSRKMVLLK